MPNATIFCYMYFCIVVPALFDHKFLKLNKKKYYSYILASGGSCIGTTEMQYHLFSFDIINIFQLIFSLIVVHYLILKLNVFKNILANLHLNFCKMWVNLIQVENFSNQNIYLMCDHIFNFLFLCKNYLFSVIKKFSGSKNV